MQPLAYLWKFLKRRKKIRGFSFSLWTQKNCTRCTSKMHDDVLLHVLLLVWLANTVFTNFACMFMSDNVLILLLQWPGNQPLVIFLFKYLKHCWDWIFLSETILKEEFHFLKNRIFRLCFLASILRSFVVLKALIYSKSANFLTNPVVSILMPETVFLYGTEQLTSLTQITWLSLRDTIRLNISLIFI